MTELSLQTDRPGAGLEVGAPTPKHRLNELGDSALAGFTLMEAMEGPWEDVRESLEARIMDQPAAIDAVVDALDSSEVRLLDDGRPRATLAFLGPSGVGKSETAKALADILGGGNGNLIKVDCSNYSHGHEVSNLTGSALGYVGSDVQPIFNRNAVEQPGTVVLFDEIEKGSQELYDLMLQIMGDGELQVSKNEIVSFKDAIIVLTSNLGAKEMASKLSPTQLGFKVLSGVASTTENLDTVALHEFNQFFRPEFVNRLDKQVVFQPLSAGGLTKVLDTKLSGLNSEYRNRFGARLTLSDATKEYLVEEARKEPHLGARPLIRAFESYVQTTFGRYIGTGSIGDGTHVRVFHRSEVGDYGDTTNTLIFAYEEDASLRREVGTALVPYHQDPNMPQFIPPESPDAHEA